MTVKELVERLQKLEHQDWEVFIPERDGDIGSAKAIVPLVMPSNAGPDEAHLIGKEYAYMIEGFLFY